MKLRHAWTLNVVLACLGALSGCASQKSRTTLPAPAEISNADRPGSENYTVRGSDPTWINPFRTATRWIWKPHAAADHSGSRAGNTAGHVDGSVTMAQMVEQRGENEKAIAMYRAILARTPNDSLVLHRLGVMYAEKEQYDVARAFLEKAVKYDTRNPETLGDLGYAYYRCGRMADAERILRESLKRDSDDTSTRNNLALILCVQGRTEEALAEFKKIGSEAEAHASLGFVLSQNGQSKLAQQHFRTAASLDRSLQSTIGVLAKDSKDVEDENASRTAASQSASRKADTSPAETATTPADASSPAKETEREQIQRAPRRARPRQSSYTSELAGRTRRPPPDPAPEPPAFSPEIEATTPARVAPVEQVVKAEPAKSPKESQRSPLPTELVPMDSRPAVSKPAAPQPTAARPAVNESIERREPQSMATGELARVEFGPAPQSPQPQVTIPPRKPQPAADQPRMVWNSTYEQSTATGSARQMGAVPRTPIVRNESPKAVTQWSPGTATSQESKQEISLAPATKPKATTDPATTDVAAIPMAEAKPLTRSTASDKPSPREAELAQEPLAPVQEIPRHPENPLAERVEAEQPEIAHLAPITRPPQPANDADTGALETPHEASIVSPSNARWQPVARKLAKSSGPPAFYEPPGTEPQEAKPQPAEPAPVKITSQRHESRLVDLDADPGSKPIEMAIIVTPADADWQPAGRSSSENKTPPPFFTLTPQSQNADDSAPANPAPITKAEQVSKAETDAAPQTVQVAEAEHGAGPQPESTDALAQLEPPAPLAPIVTADSYKAEQRDGARLGEPVSHVSEKVQAPEAHTNADSWLTAYEALVREAEDVDLQPIECAKPQTSAEIEAPRQQSLAPIISAPPAAVPSHSKAADEAKVKEASQDKSAPISLAPPTEEKPVAKSVSKSGTPVSMELPPITSAKSSGLKRPEAKAFQGSLRSEGQD